MIVLFIISIDGFTSVIDQISRGYQTDSYLGQSGRFIGAMLVMIAFFFVGGISAIIISLKKSICLTIETVDGKVEVVRLKELVKQNQLEKLTSICKQIYGLSFSNDLLKKN